MLTIYELALNGDMSSLSTAMLMIYNLALYSHIFLGCIALCLFWYPLYVKKGSVRHNQFGGYYAILMYGVGWSGTICCLLVLLDPLTIRQVSGLSGDKLQAFMDHNRQMASFLLTLSLLTIASVYHGVKVLEAKSNRDQLKTLRHLGVLIGLAICSGISLTMGLNSSSGLMIGFSLLGLSVSINNLRYTFKRELKPREWLLAHLGGMLGSGIAVYTAFAAVGGRHVLLSLMGSDAIIISWVAPGLLGTAGVIWAQRRFRVRYKIS
jgi:hypothetical protein